jgi:hypothetical protein
MWIAACRAACLPRRDGIDLYAIRFALPYVWLVEYLPDEDAFRYRLAGEHVNATFGISLRGKYLADIIEPNLLDTVRQRYLHTLKTPGAVHATGRVYSRTGRHREGERLILPISDGGEEATHLLGVTDYGTSDQLQPEPPPPTYMHEEFLRLADVLAWREPLEADARQ